MPAIRLPNQRLFEPSPVIKTDVINSPVERSYTATNTSTTNEGTMSNAPSPILKGDVAAKLSPDDAFTGPMPNGNYNGASGGSSAWSYKYPEMDTQPELVVNVKQPNYTIWIVISIIAYFLFRKKSKY